MVGTNQVKKGNVWQPNPKQIKIVQLLINPDDRRTKTEKCKEVDITMKTLWTWMKDDRFVKYMNDQLALYTDTAVAEVWNALIGQCKRGSVAAMKLFFEMKEMHPNSKSW